jgi:hypothetical protein
MKKETQAISESRLRATILIFTAMSIISPAIICYGFYLAGFDLERLKLAYLVCAPLALIPVWGAYLHKMRQLKKSGKQNVPSGTSPDSANDGTQK